MWDISKAATVLTLIAAVVLLVALVMLWWMPTQFGYPWYTILGNFFATAAVGSSAMMIRDIVNGR